MSAAWGAWGELWAFADKVDFDGPAKRITVHPLISTITTVELYSSWVRWVSLYDNLKFDQAMRTVGNDPLPGGQVTGLFLFLMNDWQIIADHDIVVDGILYHDDDGVSPFILTPGGGITNKVAALAYGYSTDGVPAATPAEIWNYSNRALSLPVPTPSDIWGFNNRTLTQVIPTAPTPNDIWTHGSRTLTQVIPTPPSTADISTAVWAHPTGASIAIKMAEVWGRLGYGPIKLLITQNPLISFCSNSMTIIAVGNTVTLTRQ